MIKRILALALAAVTGLAMDRQPTLVPIYVGPMIRDGFVVVDSGIQDSIKDIQSELRKNRLLRVVLTPKEAQLHLYITRRYLGAYRGQVTIGNLAAPLNARVVEAQLQLGDYAQPLQGDDREGGTWKHCAETLANDVDVWIRANRDKLP